MVFRFSGEIGIIRQKMRAHFSFLRNVRANVRILPRKRGAEVLKLFYLLARGNLRLFTLRLLRVSQLSDCVVKTRSAVEKNTHKAAIFSNGQLCC